MLDHFVGPFKERLDLFLCMGLLQCFFWLNLFFPMHKTYIYIVRFSSYEKLGYMSTVLPFSCSGGDLFSCSFLQMKLVLEWLLLVIPCWNLLWNHALTPNNLLPSTLSQLILPLDIDLLHFSNDFSFVPQGLVFLFQFLVLFYD